MIGDFNLSRIVWTADTNDTISFFTSDHSPMTEQAKCVCEYFNYLNFKQFNCNFNTNGGMLDLLFSFFGNIAVIPALDPLIFCDLYHSALSFSIPSSPINRCSYSCLQEKKRADFGAISEYLGGINWDATLGNLWVNDAVRFTYDHFNFAISSFVPEITIVITKSTFPSWFSRDLKNAIKLKKRAHSRFKCINLYSDYLEFTQLTRRWHEV